MVIQWSHIVIYGNIVSKLCCRKYFSNPSCETYVYVSLGNENEKAREIQCFKLRIFSFNSHVYYLIRGFIASTLSFNILTCAFNLPTRAFTLPPRAFSLTIRSFSVLTRRFALEPRGFQLVTCRFELVTRDFELITRNS